jgi:hypothetical protein
MGSAAVSTSQLSQFEDILAERRRSNCFAWASRPFNPSPYFVRGRPKDVKALCNSVLLCGRVQDAIREVRILFPKISRWVDFKKKLSLVH